MRKVEILFLLIVFGFAGTFSAMSFSKAIALYPGRSASDSAVMGGAAGKSRDVDVEELLRMLQRQDLSDREAEFYKEFPAVPRSNENE
jgi:hypothetical protein